MNFKDIYVLFRAEKTIDVKPSTAAAYAMNWKILEPHIGEKDACDFGPVEARLLLTKLLESGISPKTAKDRMAFVKQMIIFAGNNLGLKTLNNEWHLKYPQAEPRKIKSFTESEMLRIVKSATEEIDRGRTDALAILIAVLTGMRIGEVLALKWCDIDWTHNVINVHRNIVSAYNPEIGQNCYFLGTPKTKSGFREIPVIKVLRKKLRQLGGKSTDSDLFIIGNSDKPKGHRLIRDMYTRFLKRHRLPDINFHGLRHTYATLLVESGGDIKTISTLLGHATVSTTLDLYVHPTVDAKKRVVNKAFRKLNAKMSTDKSKDPCDT